MEYYCRVLHRSFFSQEAIERIFSGTESSDFHTHGLGDDDPLQFLSITNHKTGQDISLENVEYPEPVITITIEGGCVQEVTGLPPGYLYEIIDNDVEEEK